MATAITYKCTVTLDSANVRRSMVSWRAAFAAITRQLSFPEYDMEIQLMTEEDWLVLHPIVDENGAPLPLTSRLPVRPGPLPNNATTAHVAISAQRTAISDKAIERSLILKACLIESIGPDIASETADFARGHLDVESHTIYHYVINTYGIMDRDDVLHFEAELGRWDLEKPFMGNVTRMRNAFAQLATLNMLNSEVERIGALVQATRHVPSISGIINQYMILHPAMATQTFATLTAYIQLQLPFATALIRANAAAANSAAQSVTVANLTAELAASRAETAAALAAAAKIPANAPGAGKAKFKKYVEPQGKPSAADKAKWTPGRTYCWAHGFQGHTGSVCSTLASAPQWKKDAVSPGPLNSQYGSRINE